MAGWDVLHLIDEGAAPEPHRRSPELRVLDDGELRYDVESGQASFGLD
jgi:hypothetical protein